MTQDTTTVDRRLPGVPRVESTFFEEDFEELACSPQILRIAHDMHERGFAVIGFPGDRLAEHAEVSRRNLQDRCDEGTWRRRNDGMRIQDAWTWQSSHVWPLTRKGAGMDRYPSGRRAFHRAVP